MRDRGALLILFLTAALTTVGAQRLPLLKSPSSLAIVGTNVINVRNGSVLSDATIVVRNGRVESVGRHQPPPNVPLINLSGQYVVPGLIDAHAHVADIEAATRALEAGVTTIRSSGVTGYADVALRALAKQSPVAVPDVLAAGYGFRPALPPDAFLATPDYWDLESGLRGPVMIKRAVRMNASHRVDWIKIFVTEGLLNDPHRMLFTEAEVRAAVQEAAQHGILVAAHAFGDQGVASAISAGVRSIEHGSYVSESTLRLMKEKQVFLLPTIRVLTATPDSAPAAVRARVPETLSRAKEVVRMAHKIGVKVVAGTDSRYAADASHPLSQEIRELASLGFSPLQALQAATLVSAEMLRLESRIGVVERGYEADLIAVAGNPLTDISSVANPLFVMTNGRIAMNKIAPIPNP